MKGNSASASEVLYRQPQPFGESVIWRLQREYYRGKGVNAWRGGLVPHYVTNTPAVAKTYAQLLLGLFKDLAHRERADTPVYVLELGAGHGGLAYRVLEHLAAASRRSMEPLPRFCYVLSDFCEASGDFWRQHPRLAPYFERGWLDWAQYDAEHPGDLTLRNAGVTLRPKSLEQPLVVIANYVFDTIPQDLFRVLHGGLARAHVTLHPGRDPADRAVAPAGPSVSATTAAGGPRSKSMREAMIREAIKIQSAVYGEVNQGPSRAAPDEGEAIPATDEAGPARDPATIEGNAESPLAGLTADEAKAPSTSPRLADVRWQLTYEPIDVSRVYGEPTLDGLLRDYVGQLEDTHLLFPHVGLRCLEGLHELSQPGLMILMADKGDHDLSQLDHLDEPAPVNHGSFSLSVNFHAFRQYCAGRGGISFFPRHRPANLNLGCLLTVPDAASYAGVSAAYEAFTNHFGPDDMFTLKGMVDYRPDTLMFPEFMALFRMSGFDPRFFTFAEPHLKNVVTSLSTHERRDLIEALQRVWATHYELDGDDPLGVAIGQMLISLGAYQEAVACLEESMRWCGRETSHLQSIAFCHLSVGSHADAAPFVTELLESDPENPRALRMKRLCEDAGAWPVLREDSPHA